MMPDAVFYAWILSQASGGSVSASPLVSVVTKTVPSTFVEIFVCLDRRTNRGVSSSMAVKSFALFLCFSGIFFMVRIHTSLKLEGTILCSGGKMPFTNLAMYEVSKRTVTSRLRTTPKRP